jgi:hypothetical protein
METTDYRVCHNRTSNAGYNPVSQPYVSIETTKTRVFQHTSTDLGQQSDAIHAARLFDKTTMWKYATT